MKRICATIIIILLNQTGYAGLVGLTHHSRANCINNETISWHKGHNYWLGITSQHYWPASHQIIHTVCDVKNCTYQHTWRAAAVCWGEGKGGWRVDGWHYYAVSKDSILNLVAYESIADCSIYDGWWD